MKNLTVANLQRRLADMKESAEAQLAKWKGDFEKNPIYAMEWAGTTYVAAAQLEIAIRYSDYVEYGISKGEADEAIVAEVTTAILRDTLHRGGMNTNKSTSASSNLLDEARVEVLTKLAAWTQGF